MSDFNEWLDTFISEKGINTEEVLEVEGVGGTNYMPVAVVIEHMKLTVGEEQAGIKRTLCEIDFANGDCLHFIKHLAKALAV